MRKGLFILASALILAQLCDASIPKLPKVAIPPASATASAPNDDPKAIFNNLIRRAWVGDEEGAAALLFTPDDKLRARASEFLEPLLAQYVWNRALSEKFKEIYVPNPDPSYGEFARSLSTAKTTIADASAQVTIDGDLIILTRDNGTWKINPDQTLRAMAPEAQKELQEQTKLAKVWRQLTADLAAGKFKTFDDAVTEMRRAMTAAGIQADFLSSICRDITIAEQNSIKEALIAFERDMKRFPTTAETLTALLKKPVGGADNWKHPYFSTIPLDGWGRPFLYHSPLQDIPEWSNDRPSFELISPGADGKLNTSDDLAPAVWAPPNGH